MYFELDLEKPPSSSVLLLIKRAYLQTYIWLHSAFVESIEINPLEYGYEHEDDDDEVMTPNIIEEILPDELTVPCKCVKCAKSVYALAVLSRYNVVNIVIVKLKYVKIS